MLQPCRSLLLPGPVPGNNRSHALSSRLFLLYLLFFVHFKRGLPPARSMRTVGESSLYGFLWGVLVSCILFEEDSGI